jgi:hypothetical protein
MMLCMYINALATYEFLIFQAGLCKQALNNYYDFRWKKQKQKYTTQLTVKIRQFYRLFLFFFFVLATLFKLFLSSLLPGFLRLHFTVAPKSPKSQYLYHHKKDDTYPVKHGCMKETRKRQSSMSGNESWSLEIFWTNFLSKKNRFLGKKIKICRSAVCQTLLSGPTLPERYYKIFNQIYKDNFF